MLLFDEHPEFFWILAIFAAVMALVAIFSCGYYFGRRSMMTIEPDDSTPEQYLQVDEPIAQAEIEAISILEVTTGPIDILSTSLASDPEVELAIAKSRIAELELLLTTQIALTKAKDILRARYLRLLRSEREMIRKMLTGAPQRPSAYWRRWIKTFTAWEVHRMTDNWSIIDWASNIALPKRA